MRTAATVLLVLAVCLAAADAGAAGFEKDVFPASAGELAVTFIGHGTLMFEYGGKVIHVDPWAALADYAALPRADLVLLTHHHADHLDSLALRLIRKPDAEVIGTAECARMFPGITILRNGEETAAIGVRIEAVPAYNFSRPNRRPAHPRGECNGYVLTFGDTRVYLAGETDNIPELADLRSIGIAFVAMDGVYNMTPAEAAEAAKVFRPKVIYPIHYGASDLSAFTDALRDSGIETRVRKMR